MPTPKKHFTFENFEQNPVVISEPKGLPSLCSSYFIIYNTQKFNIFYIFQAIKTDNRPPESIPSVFNLCSIGAITKTVTDPQTLIYYINIRQVSTTQY